MTVIDVNIPLAFPVDIGSEPASPVRENRQRLHAGKPTRRLMKRPTAKHGGARKPVMFNERDIMAAVVIIIIIIISNASIHSRFKVKVMLISCYLLTFMVLKHIIDCPRLCN